MAARGETILILGGTSEAHALANTLMASGEARVITSLAGRTAEPALPSGEVRIGGFGGVDGLIAYLRDQRITRVIDATHPFARRISENARLASKAAGVPLEHVQRPEWQPENGDLWTQVASLEEAASALPAGARVFLALGRQYLKAFERRPDCHFVIRMVDPPLAPLDLPSHELVIGKPSADKDTEGALFKEHGITHLVARNSGGRASYGKIEAARRLAIPVILLSRLDNPHTP